MIESLRTTQIVFFRFATPSGFVGGGGGRAGDAETRYKKYPCKGSCNPMKPFVRTSFLGTKPSCLPSPGRPFFYPNDRKRMYDWAAQPAQ